MARRKKGEGDGTIEVAPAEGEDVESRVLRCFLNGVDLGMGLEELQDRAEELLKFNARTAGSAEGGFAPNDDLVGTWDVVRNRIKVAEDACGLRDPDVAGPV